jgi:hypothetical protein
MMIAAHANPDVPELLIRNLWELETFTSNLQERVTFQGRPFNLNHDIRKPYI